MHLQNKLIVVVIQNSVLSSRKQQWTNGDGRTIFKQWFYNTTMSCIHCAFSQWLLYQISITLKSAPALLVGVCHPQDCRVTAQATHSLGNTRLLSWAEVVVSEARITQPSLSQCALLTRTRFNWHWLSLQFPLYHTAGHLRIRTLLACFCLLSQLHRKSW